MIGKQDVLDRATEWQLRPEIVEKDYILGWILAADIFNITETTEELRTEWEHMLAHQLPNLPKLDNLLFRLPALLQWIDEPAAVLPEMALASAPTLAGESLVAATGIQYWGSALPLEVIRFAGANRLLIEFVYDGTHRLVEPYSLRRSSAGNLLLYGWEQGSTHIKTFTISKMLAVRSTNIAFQPRYRVEFASAEPLSAPTAAARPPLRASPATETSTAAESFRSYVCVRVPILSETVPTFEEQLHTSKA